MYIVVYVVYKKHPLNTVQNTDEMRRNIQPTHGALESNEKFFFLLGSIVSKVLFCSNKLPYSEEYVDRNIMCRDGKAELDFGLHGHTFICWKVPISICICL